MIRKKPDGKLTLVQPAALTGNVPEPFRSEPTGGGGTRLHHKFVVIDFDKPTARVYMGSYNFSSAADIQNGENLLLLRDRRIAVSYVVESGDRDRHRRHSRDRRSGRAGGCAPGEGAGGGCRPGVVAVGFDGRREAGHQGAAPVWLVRNKIDLIAWRRGSANGRAGRGLLSDLGQSRRRIAGADRGAGRVRAGLLWRQRRRLDRADAAAKIVAGDGGVAASLHRRRRARARNSRPRSFEPQFIPWEGCSAGSMSRISST